MPIFQQKLNVMILVSRSDTSLQPENRMHQCCWGNIVPAHACIFGFFAGSGKKNAGSWKKKCSKPCG